MKNKNENIKINMMNNAFPKEMLQNLLNKCLNNRLNELENSTKSQMSNLNKTSKNFKEFSKNIQQLSNYILEQEELKKEKQEKKDDIKNTNENLLRQSIKNNQPKNNNNFRTRSNTLGISKFNQMKKQNTESNINRESFISNNNNNNKQKPKLKSPEKNNKNNKINNISKDIGKNATPKRAKDFDLLTEAKIKIPKTEKIPKKINEKLKKTNTNKQTKNNINKYMNEFDNLYIGNNKPAINSLRKEKKLKMQKDVVNENYIKKEINFDKKSKDININSLKSSFSSRKGKKLSLYENNINSITYNHSTNFNDIQNIVKLVDNVNQNITKLFNDNNPKYYPSINNLMNSTKLSNENNLSNKKNEFTLKKKYLSKKEKVKDINVLELFKKDNNIVNNILKFLTFKESIFFYSINNYFNKFRISFFDSKKEELLSILDLKKDETIEIKINEIKNKFTEDNLLNKKNFEITQETKDIMKQMNNEEYFNKIKNLEINDNNKNLIIIYKILFVLLGEEGIYNTVNNDIFWKKCINYFNENCFGKIGDYLSERILSFNFDAKEFNIIQNLLKDNQTEIINEIKNNTNYLIIPLIKESLEYCGVIFSEYKTEGNIYIKILRKNQIIINYLNNLKVRYFLSKYNEEDEED